MPARPAQVVYPPVSSLSQSWTTHKYMSIRFVLCCLTTFTMICIHLSNIFFLEGLPWFDTLFRYTPKITLG